MRSKILLSLLASGVLAATPAALFAQEIYCHGCMHRIDAEERAARARERAMERADRVAERAADRASLRARVGLDSPVEARAYTRVADRLDRERRVADRALMRAQEAELHVRVRDSVREALRARRAYRVRW